MRRPTLWALRSTIRVGEDECFYQPCGIDNALSVYFLHRPYGFLNIVHEPHIRPPPPTSRPTRPLRPKAPSCPSRVPPVPQLQHVHFSPQYCCPQSALPPDTMTTNEWMDKCFGGGMQSHNLQHLDLGLNILGTEGQRVMLATQRFGDIVSSLATLTIIGYVISLDDLALLLGPFSNSNSGSAPRKLVLEVHVLSAKLLDLLADKHPCLERLDLTYRCIGDSKTGSTSELEVSHSFIRFFHDEPTFW